MSTVFERLTVIEQREVDKMQQEGKDFLWQLFQQSELSEEDISLPSYKMAIRQLEKRLSCTISYKELQKIEKEEVLKPKPVEVQFPLGERVEQEPIARNLDWMIPRQGMASEERYIEGPLYPMSVVDIHFRQLEQLRSVLGDKPVMILGASSGEAADMWTDVLMVDLYPRDSRVVQGDMNEYIDKETQRIVVLQYGYTFLSSRSRLLLRERKYVVIDDEAQPVWLERQSSTCWSNVITRIEVEHDRKTKEQRTLEFSKNLLALDFYSRYVHNDFTDYLLSMGRFPTKGLYVISSLKEAHMAEEDLGITELYYAPEGKSKQLHRPAVIGSLIVGPPDSIWILPGSFKYAGSIYQHSSRALFVPKEDLTLITDSPDVLQEYTFVFRTVMSGDSQGVNTTVTEDGLVLQESLQQIPVVLEEKNLDTLSDVEQASLLYVEDHLLSTEALLSLEAKHCVKFENGKPSLTELGKEWQKKSTSYDPALTPEVSLTAEDVSMLKKKSFVQKFSVFLPAGTSRRWATNARLSLIRMQILKEYSLPVKKKVKNKVERKVYDLRLFFNG